MPLPISEKNFGIKKNIANAKYMALKILTYIAKLLMPSGKAQADIRNWVGAPESYGEK